MMVPAETTPAAGGVPGIMYPAGQPPQGPATPMAVVLQPRFVLTETYRQSK